jgi:hypothetical protein
MRSNPNLSQMPNNDSAKTFVSKMDEYINRGLTEKDASRLVELQINSKQNLLKANEEEEKNQLEAKLS